MVISSCQVRFEKLNRVWRPKLIAQVKNQNKPTIFQSILMYNSNINNPLLSSFYEQNHNWKGYKSKYNWMKNFALAYLSYLASSIKFLFQNCQKIIKNLKITKEFNFWHLISAGRNINDHKLILTYFDWV